MSSYHYPTYIKTLMKTGAILHLLCMAMGFSLFAVRANQLRRHGRPRRRQYKAGKFDSMLMVRDEYHREMIRPILDAQPAYLSKSIFQALVKKDLVK
ncbi:hypothetical protein SteCoe_25947 [Stentor coeruleus]|uniref:Uncharacterized protein n=1 Tax=Stentor coeruleus TaxID=5963 RepID=A0A1R2BE57_9CILI|nr:hypothetical protein SteCoe_25947 [Stentor coeruleus]